MEKECSIYKVTYKYVPPGATMTTFGTEIIIYGEDLEQIEHRLEETLIDFEMTTRYFKIIKIERK